MIITTAIIGGMILGGAIIYIAPWASDRLLEWWNRDIPKNPEDK